MRLPWLENLKRILQRRAVEGHSILEQIRIVTGRRPDEAASSKKERFTVRLGGGVEMLEAEVIDDDGPETAVRDF